MLCAMILVVLVPLLYSFIERSRLGEDTSQVSEETASEAEKTGEEEGTAPPEEEMEGNAEEEQGNSLVYQIDDLIEGDIYTFLQGPAAWSSKTAWSGSWCEEVLAGQRFSVFGCGLCVLANIYCTLTRCECSPIDMFYYAEEVSGYSPVSGFGAIDWPYMQETLLTTGIYSDLHEKDAAYEDFRMNIRNSICAVVLVCSDDDSTYWQDVEGHYVNIWLYDEHTDTVFLADSGNPAHNRQRIPLRYLYDALKTSNDYQYMLVTGMDVSGNAWGHDAIDIEWNRP